VTNAERGGVLERTEGERRNLQDFALLAGWATPSAEVYGDTPETHLRRKEKARAAGRSMGLVVSTLYAQAHLAGWVSPASRDHKGGRPGRRRAGERAAHEGAVAERLDQLDRQAERRSPAPWVPCPCCENQWCHLHQMHAHECPCPEIAEWEASPYRPAPGLIASSSHAWTASGGASALNPAMSRWLMGYPALWDLTSPGWEDWSEWQARLASASSAPASSGPSGTA
jgi:hypothetical protein